MDDWFQNEQLHFAADDGDLSRVKQLIKEGFPLNEFDELGKTPLHYAAEREHLEIVQFLVEYGADVNAHDESQAGNTPLTEVAQTCSFEIAKLLVDAGADPTIPGWMQITALYLTGKRKRGDGPRVHRLLLEAAEKFKSSET